MLSADTRQLDVGANGHSQSEVWTYELPRMSVMVAVIPQVRIYVDCPLKPRPKIPRRQPRERQYSRHRQLDEEAGICRACEMGGKACEIHGEGSNTQ